MTVSILGGVRVRIAHLALLGALWVPACEPDPGPRGPGDGATRDGAIAQSAAPARGAEAEGAAPDGHLMYIPAYSHIYHHVGESFQLATTLSIRNTDHETPVTIRSVRYHDTNGRMARDFLTAPEVVAPLSTLEFVVEETDVSGGSGASFLVAWDADRPVSGPLMEAVMISTRLGQGISFTSRGVPVERLPEDEE